MMAATIAGAIGYIVARRAPKRDDALPQHMTLSTRAEGSFDRQGGYASASKRAFRWRRAVSDGAPREMPEPRTEPNNAYFALRRNWKWENRLSLSDGLYVLQPCIPWRRPMIRDISIVPMEPTLQHVRPSTTLSFGSWAS